MRRARRDAQTHTELAISDLAGRARVLALYSDRMATLLEKSRIVDDPGLDRLLGGHRRESVLRSDPTDFAVAPRQITQESK